MSLRTSEPWTACISVKFLDFEWQELGDRHRAEVGRIEHVDFAARGDENVVNIMKAPAGGRSRAVIAV